MEPTFTTRWFYKNIAETEVKPGRLTCAVCGLPMLDGIDVKRVFRPTFTDYGALRHSSSKHVCHACAWYFDNQKLRANGWVVGKDIAQAMTKDVWLPVLRNAIENGSIEDCYYLIRPSGLAGKHLALYAPLNMSGNKLIRVRYNVNTLELNWDWLAMVDAAFRLRERHAWREIESDNYITKFVSEWPNMAEFIQLRQAVKPWLYTPYLDLAIFVWSKGVDQGEDESE